MASKIVRFELLSQFQKTSKTSSADASEFLRHLQKALKFSSWLGGVPFALQSGGKLRLLPWKVAYSGLCASLVFLLFAYVGYENHFYVNSSGFSKFIFYFQAIPFSFTTTATIFCVTVYRDSIETAVQKLIWTDKMLSHLNVKAKVDYSTVFAVILQIFAFFNASVGVTTRKPIGLLTVVMFSTFPYSFCYMFRTLELFIFLINSLSQYLDAMVHQACPRENFLVKLCKVHDSLADVITCLQKVYGIPLLCLTFSCFIFLNINIFICARRGLISELPFFMGGVILGLSEILRTAYLCEKAAGKMNKFYSVVFKIMKAEDSCKLLNNHFLNAHLMKKKSFVFNAAGFFDYDFKFFGGLIAATITYSIILIQMGKDV